MHNTVSLTESKQHWHSYGRSYGLWPTMAAFATQCHKVTCEMWPRFCASHLISLIIIHVCNFSHHSNLFKSFNCLSIQYMSALYSVHVQYTVYQLFCNFNGFLFHDYCKHYTCIFIFLVSSVTQRMTNPTGIDSSRPEDNINSMIRNQVGTQVDRVFVCTDLLLHLFISREL